MFRNQHSDVLYRAFGYCSLKSVGGIGEWGNGEVFSLFPQIARSYKSNRIAIDRYRLKFTNQAFGLSAICLVSDSIDAPTHLLLLLELAQFPEQYSLHSDLG